MAKPPQMSGVEVVAALEVLGFTKEDGGSGSHQVMKNHETGATTTVSVHRSDIPPGTMRNIMQQAGVTAEELKNPRKAKRAKEKAAAAAAEAAEGQGSGVEGIFDPTRANPPAHLAPGYEGGQGGQPSGQATQGEQRPVVRRHGSKRGKGRSGR